MYLLRKWIGNTEMLVIRTRQDVGACFIPAYCVDLKSGVESQVSPYIKRAFGISFNAHKIAQQIQNIHLHEYINNKKTYTSRMGF